MFLSMDCDLAPVVVRLSVFSSRQDGRSGPVQTLQHSKLYNPGIPVDVAFIHNKNWDVRTFWRFLPDVTLLSGSDN